MQKREWFVSDPCLIKKLLITSGVGPTLTHDESLELINGLAHIVNEQTVN